MVLTRKEHSICTQTTKDMRFPESRGSEEISRVPVCGVHASMVIIRYYSIHIYIIYILYCFNHNSSVIFEGKCM